MGRRISSTVTDTGQAPMSPPGRGGHGRRVAMLFTLTVVSACSPYGFPKEVAAINTGVEKISESYAAGYAAIAADREALYRLKLTDARAKPLMATSCRLPIRPNEGPCLLYPNGSPAPRYEVIESSQAKAIGTVAVLRDYASALAAVTNAKDRDAYDAAVAQLSGAIGGLTKHVDVAAPGASVLAPALVNVFGWVVGTALDQQRYDSLRAATAIVDKPDKNGQAPIQVVSIALGGGLHALNLRRQAILQEQSDILLARLGPSLSDAQYRQRLEQAEAVVGVLDQLRKVSAQVTTDGLVTAHHRLVEAINDPARNYPALLEAVNDFADQTTALHAAFVASQKAAMKKGV